MKKPFFTSLMLLLALFTSFSVYSVPKLSSLPTASATIFLDFDGYTVNSGVWNGGVPFVCAASTMTDAQVTEIFNRVAEDYRPFEINITTDSTVFLAAPLTNRIRVVITPTSDWYPGVGGVSYVGSFTWGDDTPAFVFCDKLGNSAKNVGECCSHESGHTLGLSHQSAFDTNCNLTAIYNDGTGSGEIAWAPIMGNSYGRNMSSWSDGPTPYGCTKKQDNISIISSQNGFSFRRDDFSDDINTAATELNPLSISVDGIISTETDKDAFRFSLNRTTTIHLDAKPFSVGSGNNGANLDMKLQLFDASGNLIKTYDPATTMSVTIDTTLNTGDYYLTVDGTGNTNVSDYGSLGSYQLRGSSSVLPIRSVVLTGKADNGKHELDWNIISDENIRTIVVESSTDGKDFKAMNTVSSVQKEFAYTPFESNNIYYRLKVTSVTGEAVYSNIISLKSTGKALKSFSVSTLAYNEISVNASANYQYVLTDMNGKVIAIGNGLQGFGKIDIARQSRGMYILQLMSNNERQVERIIKQ